MPKVIENKLIEEFKDREYFTRKDLVEVHYNAPVKEYHRFKTETTKTINENIAI